MAQWRQFDEGTILSVSSLEWDAMNWNGQEEEKNIENIPFVKLVFVSIAPPKMEAADKERTEMKWNEMK